MTLMEGGSESDHSFGPSRIYQDAGEDGNDELIDMSGALSQLSEDEDQMTQEQIMNTYQEQIN